MSSSVQVGAAARMVPILIGIAAGCGAIEDPPPLASREADIVNGQVDLVDAAVVALMFSGQQYCSGTLVSPRVVITAAHCLPPHVSYSVNSIEVYFGDDVSQLGMVFPVVTGQVNPDWNDDVVANDIGMLALASDAPTEPLRMLIPGSEPRPGEPVQLIGFGFTAANGIDNGIKRRGLSTIKSTDDSTLYLDSDPAMTCEGDSGGPLLVERDGEWVLGGIHSRSDCLDESLSERIDVHIAGEVVPFLDANGGGVCPSDDVCDEDCVVDLDCAGGALVVGGCTAGGDASSLAALALALMLILRRRPAAGPRSV